MGSSVKDETVSFIESINESASHFVKQIYIAISHQNFKSVENNLRMLLITIGSRGIFVMMGFRKTTGSQDLPWPDAEVLIDNFNKANQLISVDDPQRNKGVSKLSVGARALQKHAHRSSDGFWGNPIGTEAVKNEYANTIAVNILRECIWINVHKMLQSEVIVECRIA